MHDLKTTQNLIPDHIERIDATTRGIGEEFLGFIQEARMWKADIIHAIQQEKANARDGGLMQSIPHQLERHVYLQSLLLRQLHFNGMEDRHNRVSQAHETTFQWLYQDPIDINTKWSSFTNWLASDSDVYWITGKAGSGKSTLMKYIYSDEQTFDGLELWCSGRELHTAAFFFWNSGSEMQMSQLGLLRSLLHQILSRCPSLIPVAFPARWEAFLIFGDDPQGWNLPELLRGLELLAADNIADKRLFLFIDGLDEFDGNTMDLINVLKDINESPNIKLCISSRPWVEFEDAFEDRSSLRVQDLTYRDIKLFVSSHFLDHAEFSELERREPEYASQLIEEIVRKSSGVFLWVNLVVHSLLAGFGNADRLSDLKRRLDFLPPDLESLYEKMLKSLDPFYREHASQLFQLVRASSLPPSLLCLSLADEEDDYLFKCEVRPITKEELLSRDDVMKRRLNSRCKGLLEAAPTPDPPDPDSLDKGQFTSFSGRRSRNAPLRSLRSPSLTVPYNTSIGR